MTFAESLAFILIAAVSIGLALLALHRLTTSPAPSECCHKSDGLEARIAAWRKRTGATEPLLFPLFEDTVPLPACFQCLSDETPRQAPPIARNEASGELSRLQDEIEARRAEAQAQLAAHLSELSGRRVERRAQPRSSLRPVWTPEQRRLVEDDRTGTVGRYLESDGEQEDE